MSFVFNRNRHGRLGRAGVTSVELAIVFVPFMTLMMGAVDLARYFFTVQAMTTLMTDSARYMTIVGGGGVQQGQLTLSSWSKFSNIAIPPLLDPTKGNICVVFYGTQQTLGVSTVQVTVSYPFTSSLITASMGFSGLSSTLPDPGTEQGCGGTAGWLTETTTYSY